MRTIHLKCGHNIKVKTWPSSAGMAKVRHHYKKFHPARMKKMTKKSLATKAAIKWRKSLPKGFKMRKSTFDKIVRDVMATKRKRGLVNPKIKWYIGYSKTIKHPTIFASTMKGIDKKRFFKIVGPFNSAVEARNTAGPPWIKYPVRKGGLVKNRCNPNPKPVVIYDKLLSVEARKSHGKFKGENFTHDFKHNTDAVVIGLPSGDLLIKSRKGKRLWRKFNY